MSRLWSAIRRRLRYGWRVLTRQKPAWLAVERARNWLENQSGSYPAVVSELVVDEAALYALAIIELFQEGELAEGDHQLWRLRLEQRPDGSFPMLIESRLSYVTSEGGRLLLSLNSPHAAKLFLEACEAQVIAHAKQPTVNLPMTIDPQDGRLLALIEWMNGWQKTPAKVIDVGCGPGRFLSHLVAQFPNNKWEGLDPNASLLKHLPKTVKQRKSDLYSGLRRSNYDGVYAVEVLEHCIYPERAIKVMCHALRPGGRILIIDKHAGWQKYSEHEPWERWFKPQEVCDWLEPYCTNIQVRPVAHGADRKPSGLFQCWTAEKKAKSPADR